MTSDKIEAGCALEVGQDRQRNSGAALRLARAISWIGHPLVFSTLTVAVVAQQMHNRTGAIIFATFFVSLFLPIGILLFRGVRSGRWSDADVSIRSERHRFYPKAVSFSLLSVVLLWLFHAPGYVLRGALVIVALLVIAGIANLRFKLSLHSLFSAFCVVVLFRAGIFFGILALILALFVFWSRLHLRRHSFAEMVTGTLLGLTGGIAAVWWP